MSAGLMGEFRHPADLIGAVRRLKANGFQSYDTFTPLPLAELDQLLPKPRGALLAALMAAAGIIGFGGAFLMQAYAAAISFPVNVGGRPLFSWPAFVPSAWEVCAFAVVYGGAAALFAVCRLPRLYHPVFAAPGFERASQDRFFLCVDAADRRFDAERVRFILERCGAVRVAEVAP